MNQSRVSMSGRRLAACLLLVLLLPLPALPEQRFPLKVEVKSPEAVDIPLHDGVVELTLEQAIEIALRRNLGVVIERYNRIHARLGIYQALGIYDLSALADLIAEGQQQAVTNATRPSNERDQQLNFTLSQPLPTGGSFNLGGTNVHQFVAFETSDLNTIGSSFYTSGLTVSFDQPLLRNFGREAFEHTLLVAENTSGLSQANFIVQLTTILQQVTDAYWTLVDARSQLTVAEDSLGLARELDKRNRIQVQVGTLAPLELVQSEATIATREEGIISAQETVANAADQLRRLLNFPAGQLWTADIKPLTDPQTASRPTIDVDASIAQALRNRPELRSQELTVELAKLNARFAHNQALPQLNLTLSYGAGGAATGLGIGSAFSQLTALTFPTWLAQLHLAFPLQDRTARAAAIIADVDRDRTGYELDQLKTVVVTDVRMTVRRVLTAAKQIDAAIAARKAQETNLDAERKRYENGMSTSFEITQIQDQLTAARSSEITAIVGYRTALADYYRSTGTLLTEAGVDVQDHDPSPHRYTVTPGRDETAYEKQ
jgi:outer membrane protein TolC